jgi:glycosyltransferase involved in cell wall biosynthesis
MRTLIRPMPAAVRLPGDLGRLVAKGLNFGRGLVIEPVRLAALLRRERIDLVHLNNSIIRNHPWMVAAYLAGVPCITHERGINERFPMRARLLARSLRSVICISAAVRENFETRGLGQLRLVTIHNGLDPASMNPTRPESAIRRELGCGPLQRLVGMIGNLRRWKGQDVVIRAVGLLRDEFPDLVCVLVGDTSPADAAYRKEVDSLIETLQLRQRVIITGYRDDVANYIAPLEIQIHASVSPEPFGRVLLEGMAMSKPLVASGGGAVPEIVIDGHTGLLCEPGSPESFAAALRSLLKNPARGAAMGQAGHQRLCAEFSIQHNVIETQALYDRLLSPG